MKAKPFSETSKTTHATTQRHIWKEFYLENFEYLLFKSQQYELRLSKVTFIAAFIR
jgi:hypothetical protein